MLVSRAFKALMLKTDSLMQQQEALMSLRLLKHHHRNLVWVSCDYFPVKKKKDKVKKTLSLFG